MARHVCLHDQRIDVPSRRFSHVHVDLVGPLPSVSSYTHMFTVVDRSTHWPTAYTIQDTATTACINALIKWISSFGVPATVTLDQGSQFTLSSLSAFCCSLGIQHVMTTAYQPQSNSMVERMHRQLKAPWVLLCLRSVPLEQSGVSSAELVFGTPPTLPGNSCWRPSSRRRSFSTTSTTSWIPSFCFWCTVHRLPPSGPMHLPLALWEAEYVFIC